MKRGERETNAMAKSFRSIVGLEPAKVDIKDSVLVIIDAQNEYVSLFVSLTPFTTLQIIPPRQH